MLRADAMQHQQAWSACLAAIIMSDYYDARALPGPPPSNRPPALSIANVPAAARRARWAGLHSLPTHRKTKHTPGPWGFSMPAARRAR